MGHRDTLWRGVLLLLGLGLVLALLPPRAVPADSACPLPEGSFPPAPVPTPAPRGGLVALTFDDGPRRSTTTALLDGLGERGVKATFFLVGEQVLHNEDLVKRMVREGHQVGLHTYGHADLTGLNRQDFSAQVDRCRDLLRSILGEADFALRPPYGKIDQAGRQWAGAPLILWSVDPEDWGDKDTRRIVRQVLSEAQDGDVILLHDIYPTSVEAALEIVDGLREQGFYFVTVEELFAARHIPLEPGRVYRHARP